MNRTAWAFALGCCLLLAAGLNHRDPATPSPPAAPRLGQIKVPTLVLVGEDDAADNQAQAGVVAEGVAGAVRVIVPKAGHLLYMEQPAQLVRILDRFAGGDKGAPTPGAEEALRSLLGGLQSGSTDYSRLNPGLAQALRQQGDAPQRGLAALGPLGSVTFQQIDMADSDV